MFPLISYLAAKEYHDDLLRKAAHERLAREAMAASWRPGVFARSLGWLGCRMVAWGQALEARYDKMPGTRPIVACQCTE